MAKRRNISRRKSRKVFAKGNGKHRRNRIGTQRGGVVL